MAKTTTNVTAGMGTDQLTAHVRKTIERALGTSVEIDSLKMKSKKGNSLTLTLEVTASDVRVQLLPLEKEKAEGAVQDDLAVDS